MFVNMYKNFIFCIYYWRAFPEGISVHFAFSCACGISENSAHIMKQVMDQYYDLFTTLSEHCIGVLHSWFTTFFNKYVCNEAIVLVYFWSVIFYVGWVTNIWPQDSAASLLMLCWLDLHCFPVYSVVPFHSWFYLCYVSIQIIQSMRTRKFSIIKDLFKSISKPT